MKKTITTLCVVHSDSQILLGMKKRGFGQGRWNGFGGKVAFNESIEEAAKRELREEVCIEAKELARRGLLTFRFKDNPEVIEVHLFSVTKFSGNPAETEEMLPGWFSFDSLPYKDMWPDDEHWYPLFIQGKNFEGEFLFEDQNTIIEHSLREAEALPHE